jgi:hypothetical protein
MAGWSNNAPRLDVFVFAVMMMAVVVVHISAILNSTDALHEIDCHEKHIVWSPTTAVGRSYYSVADCKCDCNGASFLKMPKTSYFCCRN